jgi:diguanylate cyclase (GGDEF)-like protein
MNRALATSSAHSACHPGIGVRVTERSYEVVMKTQLQTKRPRTADSTSPKVCPPTIDSLRRRISSRKGAPTDDLEEMLFSAVLAADKNLSHIVREVDQMEGVSSGNTHDDTGDKSAAGYSAVKHMIMERELRHLALTDDLTCLYNRRGFFAAAAHQLKIAKRNAQRMLLLFCDVDRLKQINDRYGHAEGDLALVRTADALEQAFRDSDILARLGGDEFAVLALEAGDENMDALNRRLRKSLDKANRGSQCDLSLSVGFARFDPQKPAALANLIAEADRMMYQNKRSSEMRVVQK